MKTLLTAIFAIVALCGIVVAQDATPPSANSTVPQSQGMNASPQSGAQPAAGTPRIAPGSVIPVQLTTTVDAKKAKTGDQISAKVTQDLKAGSGQVIVPKDTKVIGHVTEVQASNKEQKESQLAISFDHAVTKNGEEMTLPMSIQAIIAPSALNAGNNSAPTPDAGAPIESQNTGPMSPGNRSGMSSNSYPQSPNPPMPGGGGTTGEQSGTSPHQPITGNTQGVVGISHLTLSQASSGTQGSVVSSEKGNVKLESGTLMLLKVNQ